ncbi:MAG: hypothetical protein QF815_02120, partial [Candidatus Peribacteraceae bacterium]|nr:hypothetical protein [Candidatus Peribacteraceae bacterium]
MRIPIDPHQFWPEEEPDKQAHLDEAGNIIIPGANEPVNAPVPRVTRQPVLRQPTEWEVTEEDEVVREARKTEPKKDRSEQVVRVLKRVRGGLMGTTSGVIGEGKRQYAHSYHRAKFHIGDLRKGFRSGASSLWGFMAQPVWVMQKDKPAKEYSRGSLFFLDVVRFGGTFAAIFVALFVSLNYQSFFQIITPYLDPVERVSALNGNIGEVDNALKEKLLKSPALAIAGRKEGELLSYLP